MLQSNGIINSETDQLFFSNSIDGHATVEMAVKLRRNKEIVLEKRNREKKGQAELIAVLCWARF